MEAQLERSTDREAITREALFREVNENIAALCGEWSTTETCVFVCECSRTDCAEAVEMRLDEYEQVRRDGARFLLLAGHELPEDLVIDQRGRYLITEKTGARADLARESDPRRHA